MQVFFLLPCLTHFPLQHLEFIVLVHKIGAPAKRHTGVGNGVGRGVEGGATVGGVEGVAIVGAGVG